MKEKILERIKNKVNSISDERKRKLITSIINKKDWYLHLDLDTFNSILKDLGFEKEDIKAFYIALFS